MASEWFYQVMGEKVGPVSALKMPESHHAGTIDRNALVRNGSESGSRRAHAWVVCAIHECARAAAGYGASDSSQAPQGTAGPAATPEIPKVLVASPAA